MASAQESFSATARAGELVPKAVEISGIEFKVRRTGRALRSIIELEPEENLDEADMDPGRNIEILYKGLSYVLVNLDEGEHEADENGHPSPDWLMDNLDFEVAQELMEKFVPRRAEGNSLPAENTSTPATAVQP